MKNWLTRTEWALAFALTAVALLLHVRILTHAGPLWRDEANTVAVASRTSVAAMVAALEHESFPVLPFAAVRAWSAAGMGGSDFRLRLLGLLVGVGILAAVWWNQRLTRGAAPILALALFALNPVVLRWGDSLRGYGAGALAIIVAFGLVYRLAATPSPAAVAWGTAASLLAVQCIYQDALLLAAACAGAAAVAVARRRPRDIGLPVAVGAVAAASLIPYAGIIARAREHFVVITLSADFARIWKAFLEALGPGVQAPAVWFLAYALALAVGAWSWWTSRREKDPDGSSDLALYGTTVAVVAPLLFFLFVYRLRFLTEPWYFIVLLGIVAVSLDAALGARKVATSIRLAKLALGLAAALLAVVSAVPSLASRQTNIDRIAETLRQQASRDDLVVINPWFYGVSFGRYYRGEAPWVLVPMLADREIHRFDLVKEMMTRRDPLEGLFGRMAGTLRTGHRVWVVGSLAAPPRGQAPRRRPPASDATGWYSAPYLGSWTQEVGFFLQSRGERGSRVPVQVDGAVSPYEKLSLSVVEGWKQVE